MEQKISKNYTLTERIYAAIVKKASEDGISLSHALTRMLSAYLGYGENAFDEGCRKLRDDRKYESAISIAAPNDERYAKYPLNQEEFLKQGKYHYNILMQLYKRDPKWGDGTPLSESMHREIRNNFKSYLKLRPNERWDELTQDVVYK